MIDARKLHVGLHKDNHNQVTKFPASCPERGGNKRLSLYT